MTLSALIWLFTAILATGLLAGLRRIPDGTVCTVHRFGRYVRVIGPGLHLTWPLLDHIAHRVSLFGHQIELPDGSDGRCTTVVYFQILDPQLTGEVLEQIDALVEREARRRLAVLAATPSSDAVGIAGRLKQELNTQLGALGLRVTRCQLRTA